MAKHNALISGSFVLQYFARVTYEASDLDVFIHIDDDIESFGNYLTSVEGYNHVETKGTERYAAAGVTKVIKCPLHLCYSSADSELLDRFGHPKGRMSVHLKARFSSSPPCVSPSWRS